MEGDTSVDGYVRVASHLSNLPSIATEALTLKRTVLVTGVMTKTAPCARAKEGSRKKMLKKIR